MLRQLQKSSAIALMQYTRAINRTQKLLSDSLSSAERSILLEQFRKETRAYDKYMRARRKLWSALTASESLSVSNR